MKKRSRSLPVCTRPVSRRKQGQSRQEQPTEYSTDTASSALALRTALRTSTPSPTSSAKDRELNDLPSALIFLCRGYSPPDNCADSYTTGQYADSHTVVVQWIPSHSNVPGNESPDTGKGRHSQRARGRVNNFGEKLRSSPGQDNTGNGCNNIHVTTDPAPTIWCPDHSRWLSSGCTQATAVWTALSQNLKSVSQNSAPVTLAAWRENIWHSNYTTTSGVNSGRWNKKTPVAGKLSISVDDLQWMAVFVRRTGVCLWLIDKQINIVTITVINVQTRSTSLVSNAVLSSSWLSSPRPSTSVSWQGLFA